MSAYTSCLTKADVFTILTNVYDDEMEVNETHLGLTQYFWEKLHLAERFIPQEEKIIKEVCRQFSSSHTIRLLQHGLFKLIRDADPQDSCLIHKLEYISAELDSTLTPPPFSPILCGDWTLENIKQNYKDFLKEVFDLEKFQESRSDITQAVQSILEKFDGVELFRTPLFFVLFCIQNSPDIEKPLQTAKEHFLAFFDEMINRNQIQLNCFHSSDAFKFCIAFMLRFQSKDTNLIHQSYMMSREKKKSDSENLESPSSRRVSFSPQLTSRTIKRASSEESICEDQTIPIPVGDTISAPLKFVPQKDSLMISFQVLKGAAFLRTLEHYYVRLEAMSVQKMLQELEVQGDKRQRLEGNFYRYVQKRVQDLQKEHEIGPIEACSRFIQQYKVTMQKLCPPFLLCGQASLSLAEFPPIARLLAAAQQQEEEWLEQAYAKRLPPGVSQLEAKELEALEQEMDSLSARSHEIYSQKVALYTRMFDELVRQGIVTLILFLRERNPYTQQRRARKIWEQGCISTGDIYETAKAKFESIAASRSPSKNQVFLEIILLLTSNVEYFSDMSSLQKHFYDYICPSLVLKNTSLSIFFPVRLKALLKEYHWMRPFLV